MKTGILKRYFILAISMSYFSVQAQINVGPVERVTPKIWQFEKGDVELLKGTTTIFIIGDDDEENRDLWDSSLREVWNITDMEVKTHSEFKEMESYEGYSFFMLSGYMSVNGSSVNSHFYIVLWKPGGKKGKYYARLELYPDFKTVSKMNTLFYDKDQSKAMKYLYGDAFYYNWYPGMIANMVAEVNQNLSAGSVRWLFSSETEGDLSPLKETTLYIPDYCLIDYNKWNGDESKKMDAAELMEDYPYAHQFISAEELDEMLLNKNEPVYYLTYVRSSTDKFINIVNSATGEVLYSDYTGASYNIKDKDFAKLTKVIDGKKK